MKRLVLLILLSVMSLNLFGCDRKNNEFYRLLDTDKAEKIALGYMSEKYDETFCVISSEKGCEQGYVPGSIQFYWCDVEIAIKDSDPSENYTVRVTLDENSEDYIIQWDTYMVTLITPLVERDIDNIISELGVTEYCIEIYDICEEHIGGKGFTPGFNISPIQDTLKSIIKQYDLWLCFGLYLPESSYESSFSTELQQTLESEYSHKFSDDYIRVSIITFDNEYYSEISQIIKNGNELPDDFDSNEIYHDVVRL